jgi:hypothetical protein
MGLLFQQHLSNERKITFGQIWMSSHLMSNSLYYIELQKIPALCIYPSFFSQVGMKLANYK